MAQIGLTGQARSQPDRQIAYGPSPFVRPTLRFHDPAAVARTDWHLLSISRFAALGYDVAVALEDWTAGDRPVGELHPSGCCAGRVWQWEYP